MQYGAIVVYVLVSTWVL